MTKKIVILGIGGNSIDILDTVNEINRIKRRKIYECVGFLDDNPESWGKYIYNIRVLGPINSSIDYHECYFVNGIGSPVNFWKKNKIIDNTNIPSERFETIIHPTASVSSLSKVGAGVVIFQNVTVTSNVSIGNHVVILPNSVISHDDIVGDYTCIAGGVCVSGNVKIGVSCYLGTNSSIIGNTKIGDYCLIGMASVVLHDVPDNRVVVGNPAKVLRRTM